MRILSWVCLAVMAVVASGALAQGRGGPAPDVMATAQQSCADFYPPEEKKWMFKACVETSLRIRETCGAQARPDEKQRSMLGQFFDAGSVLWLKQELSLQKANFDQQSKQLDRCTQQFRTSEEQFRTREEKLQEQLKASKQAYAQTSSQADKLSVELASMRQAHEAHPLQVFTAIATGHEKPNPMAILAGILGASTVVFGAAWAWATFALYAKPAPSMLPATETGQRQFLAWAGQLMKPATPFKNADAALPELKYVLELLNERAGKFETASGLLKQYGVDLSPQSLGGEAMAGATTRLRSLAAPVLVQSLQSARGRYTNLERNQDFPEFERATELRAALEECAKALAPVFGTQPEERETALSAALLDGLSSSWLRNILRAELLLSAYAGTNTPWAELGFMLTSFATNVRLVLAGSGYQLMTHPLLSPPGAMEPTVMYSDERGIRHIRFVREAVEAAVADFPDAGTIVVDNLVFGYLGPNKRGQRPIVVLYSPTEWQS